MTKQIPLNGDMGEFTADYGNDAADTIRFRQQEQVNRIISRCNAATFEESVAKINNMPAHLRVILFDEYRRKPDGRFGDNLLVAISDHFGIHVFQSITDN